ncbi:hypothetical protein NQ317_019900 [Molorchus minor]|uniref:Alpha-2-macroglobulin domain-containing protein n=1 Tax=Molorchus minor TaxID=1323400 RepID=A0ABQ9J7P8_9CUCU|nr:hypothetical protein NQ317_019900 [Molorchus minor]
MEACTTSKPPTYINPGNRKEMRLNGINEILQRNRMLSVMASTGLTLSAPQEAGKWSLWALTVSSGGLRFSPPIQVQVFRPLQVEFHLPPSLRVRETLEVDIKIGNNINSCMDVTALLALSEGAQFLSNGLLYVTERLRLGPHGATSLVVRLLVTSPGRKNMTVEVNGYTSSSCEGTDRISNSTLTGAVVRSATVKVYPEGIVKTDTESAYFCANENLIVSTIDNYKYEWIVAPRNRQSIIIETKAGRSKNIGPLHIVLGESKTKTDRMYRITIGDAENSNTHIGRGKHGTISTCNVSFSGYGIQLTSIETPGILSEDEWKTFWITWERNTISFGNGSVPYNNTLLKWRMDKKIKIQQLGFASSWGTPAEFRIWNFNEESGFSQVLHLDTPKSVVPGSEYGELVVAGGLALPAISKSIEGGGLTGALASLSPLLTLQHLGRRANETERLQILETLPGSIQSILSYRKVDNSFSEHQMLGSHRVTVSILEALTRVQPYFSVDPDLIQAIKRWVQLRQEDDGRFTPLDADVKLAASYGFNPSRRNLTSDSATFDNIVEITAETVIALYEIGIESDADSDTLQKAKIFLENSLPNVESPETISAVTLALVLVRSATAAWAIEKLRNASTTEDGEFGWPHFMPRRDAANWLYESEAGKTLKEPLVATVDEYKASLYALTTFCLIGDLKAAESVARFLFYRSHMLDKHHELLYPAVKAFSQYDTLAKDRHRSLTISLATSGMELTDTLELNSEKSPQMLFLPSLPTKVFVYATGAGCATIQGRTTFSTYSTKSKTDLLELWSGVIEEILPDRSSVEEIEGKLPMLKLKICFKWKGNKPSPILRLEVTLFSGFELTTTPPQLLNPPQEMAEMQHNYHTNKLWFIFANVSTTCPICVQFVARSAFVITSLRPGYSKIYPASREDLAVETFFHAQIKSNLLKSVTADDMITWFGRNGTSNKDALDVPEECKMKDTDAVEKIVSSSTNKPKVLQKLTLDLTAHSSNISKSILSPTVEVNILKIADPSEITIEEVSPPQSTSLEPIAIEDLGAIEENIIPLGDQDERIEFPTIISTTFSPSNKTGDSININTENVSFLTSSMTESTTLKTVEVEERSKVNEDTTEAFKEPVAIKHKVVIKHVNKEDIHDIPKKYSKNHDEDTEVITFGPEIKNDQYILLDKKALWGMLKEVVDDEFKEKTSSKIVDGQKLRSQGFT